MVFISFLSESLFVNYLANMCDNDDTWQSDCALLLELLLSSDNGSFFFKVEKNYIHFIS